MRYTHVLVVACFIGTTPAIAQHGKVPDQDPVRVKYADSRQYRNEPKGNAAKRMTRCKIVVQKGQDKRVCGVPTSRSPGDGRNR